MFKYSYQVTLEYEYINNESFQRTITYEYEDMEYEDRETGILICLKKDFKLNVSEVVADNRDDAFSITCDVIQKVCRVLTILLQIKNYDNRESCPNLTFLPYKVQLLCEKELEQPIVKNNNEYIFMDRLGMHDAIAKMHITTTLDLNLFEKIYCNLSNKDFIDTGDVIYKAVLAENVESRFFQLFTIIEAVETKYGTDEEISHRMIQSDKVEMFEDTIKDLLENLDIENDYKTRLNSRLVQIIKTATIESRAEKLCDIIRKKCSILEVNKGLIKYSINSNKMKEFIDVRNRLFHGKHIEKKDYNNLVQRTNELQELCLLLLGL